MNCGKNCEYCDGGGAMNNIPLETVQPTETYLTANDCVDCGKVHTPGPCIECGECNRLCYLDDLGIRPGSTYICSSCCLLEQQLDLPFAKPVSK